jgi:hypothetical protein
MTIRINPNMPVIPPVPLKPLPRAVQPQLDKGKIVGAKDVGPGEIKVRQAQQPSGTRKALVDENKRYI